MRSQTTSSSSSATAVVASSSARFLTTVVDFNRNRSTESTEPAHEINSKKTMQSTVDAAVTGTSPSGAHNQTHRYSSSISSSCAGGSCTSAEGRCIPQSPTYAPPTPPRENIGSPLLRHGHSPSWGGRTTPPPHQPFLLPRDSAAPLSSTFLLPPPPSSTMGRKTGDGPTTSLLASSSWRGVEVASAEQLESLFRSSPRSEAVSEDDEEDCMYIIHRCNAFDDEDDDDDDDNDDAAQDMEDEDRFEYSEDEEDSGGGFPLMAEF